MPEKLITVKKRKANKKHGFLKRNRTRTGRAILKRRRSKGRKKV